MLPVGWSLSFLCAAHVRGAIGLIVNVAPEEAVCERSGRDREESRSDGHDHGRFGETFPLSPVVTFAMARRHRPRSYGVIQRLFEVEPSSPLAARGTRARG